MSETDIQPLGGLGCNLLSDGLSVIVDHPTMEDKLEYGHYATVLAGIILNSANKTPLTIGIHGSWGSGKTSIMKMIQNRIDSPAIGRRGSPVSGVSGRKARSIWFNAWKYGHQEVLWTALIQTILTEIEKDRSLSQDVKTKILNLTKEVTKTLAFYVAGSTQHLLLGIPSKILEQEAGGIDSWIESNNPYSKMVSTFNEFEGTFHDIVSEYVGEDGCLVVFIDDLDRCLPEKAVEVLEAVKLFLNSERCIFVVGVDKDVVSRGIAVKYQAFIRQDGSQESGGPNQAARTRNNPFTGQDYLEKIIQVPFSIPPLDFKDIERYLAGIKGIPWLDEYPELVRLGVEKNPRKINLFINSFQLQNSIAHRRGLYDPKKVSDPLNEGLHLKFALICYRWRDFFNDLQRLYVIDKGRIDYPLLNEVESFILRLPEGKVPTEKASGESGVVRGAIYRRGEPEEEISETVKRYASDQDLKDLLLVEPHFGGIPLTPYLHIALSSAPVEAQSPVAEEDIMGDLLSRDQLKITSASSKVAQKSPKEKAKVIEVLLRKLDNEDQVVRSDAALALGSLKDVFSVGRAGEVVDRLVALTGDKEPLVRDRAAFVLGNLGDVIPADRSSAVVDCLMSLLPDKYIDVRGNAGWALCNLKGIIPADKAGEVVDRLVALTGDKNLDVRRNAEWVLNKFKGLSPKDRTV